MGAPPTYVLRIHGPEAGPWSISLGPPGTHPATGTLSADGVATLRTHIAHELDRPAKVLIPGRDHRQIRAEAAAGQALLAATSGCSALDRAWGRLASELGVAGGVLLVDAHPPSARKLPWELLAHTPQAPPMALGGDVVVARLRPSTTRPLPPRGPPIPAMWSISDAEDPVAADVRTQLTQAWSQKLAPPVLGTATWLHVLAHGSIDPSGDVRLCLGDRHTDASTAMDQLSPYLQNAVAVMLAVCHAGGPLPQVLAELPSQLVHGGAGIVVGAVRAVSPEALGAFAHGVAQDTHPHVYSAIAAGWRAVRAAALPWPDARWHRLHVFVSGPGPLVAPLTSPQTPLEHLLDAAQAQAHDLHSGFCGVEHLLLALPDVAVPPSLQALRYRAGLCRDRVRAQLAHLQPQASLGPSTPWSPRLAAHLEGPSAAQTLDALWSPLLGSVAPLLADLLDMPSHTPSVAGSFDTMATRVPPPGGPATHLEVLGGPEDGKLLRPQAGQFIGRRSRSAPSAWALYDGTPLVDARVSRQHVRWEGPGTLHLRRPGQVEGAASAVGRVCVRVGEVLLLGGATRLLGRGDAA